MAASQSLNKMDETKKKVFIIDDDEFLLDMYAVKFRESGFEIEVASSGTDALKKIKDGWAPDVVLLDLVMPGMDGFEFLKNVKSGNLIPRAVIIILTNLGQKEDVERGMSLGVKDYVIKANHTPSEVVGKVRMALGQ